MNLSAVPKVAQALLGLVLLLCLANCGGGGTGSGGSTATLLFLSKAPDAFGVRVFSVAVLKDNGASLTLHVGSDAAWSPDGKSIAFDTGDPSVSFVEQIFVMGADGSGLTQVTHESTGGGPSGDVGPQWSPDGRRLAFTNFCCNAFFTFDAEIINVDGTGERSIHGNADAGGWSPDGSKVLFVVDGGGSINNVGIVTADGLSSINLTNLTAVNATSTSPIWSPDGTKVAFVSARALNGSDAANLNATTNIWIVNTDGTGAQPLTKITASGAGCSTPVWSPDGTKLAFASSRALDGSDAANLNTTSNIWLMNADGTGAQPLTKLTASGAGSTSPDWSPDGTKLAFDSSRALDGSNAANASSNIWVVHPDGTGAAALTSLASAGTDNTKPRWRP